MEVFVLWALLPPPVMRVEQSQSKSQTFSLRAIATPRHHLELFFSSGVHFFAVDERVEEFMTSNVC
jgi:hypothetical protein